MRHTVLTYMFHRGLLATSPRPMSRNLGSQCDSSSGRVTSGFMMDLTAGLSDTLRACDSACRPQLTVCRSKYFDTPNRSGRVGLATGRADVIWPLSPSPQVAAQKKLLRCGVCNSRQKDCIITKCWHLFCHQCIRWGAVARRLAQTLSSVSLRLADITGCVFACFLTSSSSFAASVAFFLFQGPSMLIFPQ